MVVGIQRPDHRQPLSGHHDLQVQQQQHLLHRRGNRADPHGQPRAEVAARAEEQLRHQPHALQGTAGDELRLLPQHHQGPADDDSPRGVDRFRGHRRELRREPERRLRLLGGGAGDPQQELGVDERHQRFARQGPHQADQRQAEEHRLSARRGQPAETALPGRRLAVRHLRRAFGRHRPRHGTGNLHQQKRRLHLQVRRRGRGGRGQHAAQTARHVAQHAALQGMVAELRLQLHLRRRHLQQNPLGEGGRQRPALQRRRTRLYGPLEEPGRPVALPRHQGAAFDDPAQLGAFRGAAQRTVAF